MKGLDWPNESYVRVYRSDSPVWNILGFEAQALYLALMRKLDAAGVLSLSGLSPQDAVHSFFPTADREMIARSLDRLLEREFLLLDVADDQLIDPEFLERETASRSDRQRQRDSRARRRSVAFRDSLSQPSAPGHEGTQPDPESHEGSQEITASGAGGGTVADRDSTTEIATAGHGQSGDLTEGHSLPLPLISLQETTPEGNERHPQRRRVSRVLSVFAKHGRALPNRSAGAWIKRLSQYAERHGDPDAGCDALVADLESIADADKLVSSAYVLKIIDGQLEQRRTGRGLYRPRSRRPDVGIHPGTRALAEELDR